ncbi:MAG: ferritin-like domain-containing protein [Myxococcota bacterium]
MSLALSLDYETRVPTLQRLLTVSEKTRWTSSEIDWERHLSDGDYGRILEWHGALRSRYVQALSHEKKEELARQFVAYDFSQTLHGEQCAMMVSAQLVSILDDIDARIYAANQARDEARHVESVHKAVRRLGPIYPVWKPFDAFITDLVNCTSWPRKMLGLQLFLEARALLDFRQHLLFVQDPVFCEAVHRIERDESQHVAFGVQYLARGVEAASEEEREEIIRYGIWLDEGIWNIERAEEYRQAFDACDLDFSEFRASLPRPSRLHPTRAISRDSAQRIETLHLQFRRWFYAALSRSGLTAVIERRLGRPLTDEERQDARKLNAAVLPWVKNDDPPAEP